MTVARSVADVLTQAHDVGGGEHRPALLPGSEDEFGAHPVLAPRDANVS